MLEKYIYKGLKPFTLGLIPSRSRTITDGAGNISVGAPMKGVKIIFTDGSFEVNETTAASYIQPNGKQFTVKALKKALEAHPFFGTSYKKVFDSTEATTKEQVEFNQKADESSSRRGIGVTKGPRVKAK